MIGQARLVRDGAELTRLSALELTPWAPGRRDHFMVITPRS